MPLLFITGEFGIVYRARLIRSTIRRTDCEIVAVKTVKGKDILYSHDVSYVHIYSYTITLAAFDDDVS